MSRTSSTLMGLFLMCMLSAVMSASAQAEPEFKPKSGKFPVEFSSPSPPTGKPILETKGKQTVICYGTTVIKGQLAAARLAKEIVITFKECKAEFGGGGACKTKGKAAGEIVTETLEAKPVYIEGKIKSKEERGLDFARTGGKGGKFAEFECTLSTGTEVLKVENGKSEATSVIARVPAGQVGVLLKTFTINFREKAGKQEPVSYEEPFGKLHEDFFETEGLGPLPFAKEPSGLSTEEAITWAKSEEVELS
jgi:hypothetical protein